MADRFKLPPVALRMDRCANCRHYAPEVLREMPPTCRQQGGPTMIPIGGQGGQMAFVGMWPPTKPELWCPKWEVLNDRDVLNRESLSSEVSN